MLRSIGSRMAVKPIPDDQHVARHVKKRPVDPEKHLCFPQAFALRPATEGRPAETYLSSSWLEFFPGDLRARLKATLAQIRGYPFTVKAKDVLAIGNVRVIKGAGESVGTRLRVLHEPDPPSKTAYAAIRGMRQDDSEICELLAAAAFAEVVVVSAI